MGERSVTGVSANSVSVVGVVVVTSLLVHNKVLQPSSSDVSVSFTYVSLGSSAIKLRSSLEIFAVKRMLIDEMQSFGTS
jgi:hypothetical protein